MPSIPISTLRAQVQLWAAPRQRGLLLAPTGALGLSFRHTVSSTVSYSMDDIEYTQNSSTREVCYDYESKNVNVYDSDDNKDEATTALSSVNATKIDDK